MPVVVVAQPLQVVGHYNPGIVGIAVLAVAGHNPQLHTEDIPVRHHIAVGSHLVRRPHIGSDCIRTVDTAVVRIVGTVEIGVGMTARPV